MGSNVKAIICSCSYYGKVALQSIFQNISLMYPFSFSNITQQNTHVRVPDFMTPHEPIPHDILMLIFWVSFASIIHLSSFVYDFHIHTFTPCWHGFTTQGTGHFLQIWTNC